MARRKRIQRGEGFGSIIGGIGKGMIKSVPKIAVGAAKRVGKRLPRIGARFAKRGARRLAKRAPRMAMRLARTKGKRLMRRLPGMAMRFARKKSTQKIGKKLLKHGMRMLMNKFMPGQTAQPQQQSIGYDQVVGENEY